MLSWAVTFLVIAIVASVLGLSGIAGMAVHIALILFVVGLVLALIFFITGRRCPFLSLHVKFQSFLLSGGGDQAWGLSQGV